MKAMIVAAALVLASSLSFAQNAPTEPATAPAQTGNTGAPSEVAPGGPAGGAKMTKKEAKATCKTEGKKGKELKQCIKEKTM